MPARRTPPKLKLLAEGAAGRVTDPVARDAQLAGLGIDWTVVPEVLDDAGRMEWNRLAAVFAGDLAGSGRGTGLRSSRTASTGQRSSLTRRS